MVCVLQSKLPGSSAIFRLYYKPFFFPPKSPHILHLLLPGWSSATALLHPHPPSAFNPPQIRLFFCQNVGVNAARTSSLFVRLKLFLACLAPPPSSGDGGRE